MGTGEEELALLVCSELGSRLDVSDQQLATHGGDNQVERDTWSAGEMRGGSMLKLHMANMHLADRYAKRHTDDDWEYCAALAREGKRHHFRVTSTMNREKSRSKDARKGTGMSKHNRW